MNGRGHAPLTKERGVKQGSASQGACPMSQNALHFSDILSFWSDIEEFFAIFARTARCHSLLLQEQDMYKQGVVCLHLGKKTLACVGNAFIRVVPLHSEGH